MRSPGRLPVMLANALLCALCLSVASPSSAVVGDSGKSGNNTRPADRTEVIEDLLDQFADSLRKRPGGLGRNPEVGLSLLRELSGRFDGCGPRDRRDIVKSLVRGIQRFDLEQQAGREFVYAAANALGSMAPESVDPLLDLVVDNRIEKELEVHRRLILALGQTRHEDTLSRLKKLLHHDESAIEAAAAEALGEFDGLEEAKRKEVFYALLTRLIDAKTLSDLHEVDLTHRRRYETIIGAMTSSLQRLSKHDERDPEQWQRFWNKNKRKPWGATAP